MKKVTALNLDKSLIKDITMISKALNTNKSDLSNNLLTLGIKILKLKEFKNLDIIENEIIKFYSDKEV